MEPEFLGAYLLGRQTEIELLATGTTGQTELSRTALGKLPVQLPPPEIMKCFAGLVKPLNESIQHNLQQARTLEELRDTLLPRLISGRLRVPDAEVALAEAL